MLGGGKRAKEDRKAIEGEEWLKRKSGQMDKSFYG